MGVETGGAMFLAWSWTLSLAAIIHVTGSVWAAVSLVETARTGDNGMVCGSADMGERAGRRVASGWSVETEADRAVLGRLALRIGVGAGSLAVVGASTHKAVRLRPGEWNAWSSEELTVSCMVASWAAVKGPAWTGSGSRPRKIPLWFRRGRHQTQRLKSSPGFSKFTCSVEDSVGAAVKVTLTGWLFGAKRFVRARPACELEVERAVLSQSPS